MQQTTPAHRSLFSLLFVLCVGACVDVDEFGDIHGDETSAAEIADPPPDEFRNGPDMSNLIQACEGFGFYEDDWYDCGYRLGYEDYVFHYNYVVQSLGLPDCHEVMTLVRGDSPVDVSFQAVAIPSGYNVPVLVDAEFELYQENLWASRNLNSYKAGQYAGYFAIRGHEPYVSGDGCGSNTPSPPPWD